MIERKGHIPPLQTQRFGKLRFAHEKKSLFPIGDVGGVCTCAVHKSGYSEGSVQEVLSEFLQRGGFLRGRQRDEFDKTASVTGFPYDEKSQYVVLAHGAAEGDSARGPFLRRVFRHCGMQIVFSAQFPHGGKNGHGSSGLESA